MCLWIYDRARRRRQEKITNCDRINTPRHAKIYGRTRNCNLKRQLFEVVVFGQYGEREVSTIVIFITSHREWQWAGCPVVKYMEIAIISTPRPRTPWLRSSRCAVTRIIGRRTNAMEQVGGIWMVGNKLLQFQWNCHCIVRPVVCSNDGEDCGGGQK